MKNNNRKTATMSQGPVVQMKRSKREENGVEELLEETMCKNV